MVTIKIFVDEVTVYTDIYRDQLTQSDNLHMIWRNKVFMSVWSPFKILKILCLSQFQVPTSPQANPQGISLM